MIVREQEAYVLLIDGLDQLFTSSRDVADSYATALGYARAYPGLLLPSSFGAQIDPRAGTLRATSTTIEIADIDNTLAQIFANPLDDAEPLLVKVPAGTAALGPSFYDTNIGTERIGPAGERRRYSCVPGYAIGPEHISEQQAHVIEAAAAPVSDGAAPVLMAGRRAALYRLARSPGDDWPDLADEAVRRSTRIWWGTLTGAGDPNDRVWSLRCAGEESWMMGSVGTALPQTGVPIEVGVQWDTDALEHVVIGALDVVNLFDELDVLYTYVLPVEFDVSATTTYADLAAEFDVILTALADDVGLGPAFSSQGLCGLRYVTQPIEDGVHIRFDRDAAFLALPEQYTARARLLASKKAWLILGFDPETQNASIDPVENPEIYGRFGKPWGTTTAEAQLIQWSIDYPGHYLGSFFSADSLALRRSDGGSGSAAEQHTSNYGEWRRWGTIYPGGVNLFDIAAGRLQPFRLRTFDPIYLPSSKAVPLPADPDDPTSPATVPGIGEVTHQGIVAISGPYRDETDAEAEVLSLTLIARVAWRQFTDGSVATDAEGYPGLLIYDWPDPRLYGVEASRPSLWGSWRTPPDDGEPTLMRPLIVLEHGLAADVIGYVFARILASTGAAGDWYTDDTFTTPAYGLSTPAVLEAGPNDLGLAPIGDELLGRYTDAEGTSLGVGVPAEMIAIDLAGSVATAIEGHATLAPARCKVVLGKVGSFLDLTRQVLAPIGWSVSLAGGRFGIFDPFRFDAPSGPTLGPADFRGEPGKPLEIRPTQELRKWAPIDRVELDARVDPTNGNFAATDRLRSPDPGVAYRGQSVVHRVAGDHMVHPRLPITGADWRASWLERWRAACRWWARQHFQATFDLPVARHAEVWPGEPIQLSSEWLVSTAAAEYGITQAAGYVIGRQVNPERRVVTVTALVAGQRMHIYAGGAIATRYDEDDEALGYRLFVEDDWLGVRAGASFDAEAFVEPPWSTAGGDVSIEAYAFDGSSWSGGIFGTVTGVHLEPGNCWLELSGALTGATWLRDHHHLVVLRTFADQAAPWPLEVHAPVGDETGIYSGSDKSPPFED